MKKTLIALATLGAFSGVALAASSVTLYGVVDGSAVVSKVKHDDTKIQMKSGFRNGSRWGIKGIEDLGNGYAVGFILEQGYNMNNGTVANGWENDEGNTGAFNRESKLFVQGDFGQIGFGRLGSLAGGAQSNSMLTGWALGTSYGGGSWTSLAAGNGRLNNAIAYVSPVLGGFKFSAMYSNGIKKDENQWSDNSHYYGVGAQYSFGGFTNSLIFEALDNDGNTGKYARANKYLINLGIGYKFGWITPQFAYQYNWQEHGVKDNIFGLSAAADVGGGVLKVGTRYLFGKNDNPTVDTKSDKRRVWSLNAAYEYPLSKRTTVWAYGGYATGAKQLGARAIEHAGAAAKKDADHYTAVTKASNYINYNGYQFALGMTHNF